MTATAADADHQRHTTSWPPPCAATSSRPGDPGYDEARAVYNAMIDKRPAAIARCRDTADVIACVRFAREHDLEIAVRGGGHNAAGLGVWDDALVIDLSLLRSTTVNPEDHTVRVDAGCTWGDVDHATVAFGMATPSGFLASTGVAGLTLGGGIGYLSRRFGLTVDNLLSADVVLADGSFVTASETSHPDLFWALRGGGGNFGIVTSFTFRCHDIGEHGTIIGGPVLYDIADTAEVMRWYRELLPSLPEELSGWIGAAHHPARRRRSPKRSGAARPAASSGATPDRTTAPTRCSSRSGRYGSPLLVGPAADAVHRAAERVRPPLSGRAAVVLAGGLLQRDLRRRDRRARQVRRAAADRALDHAPVPHRRRRQPGARRRDRLRLPGRRLGGVIVGVDPDPANAEPISQWARDYWQELHPTSAGGAYVNFMMDEGQDRVQAVLPRQLRRGSPRSRPATTRTTSSTSTRTSSPPADPTRRSGPSRRAGRASAPARRRSSGDAM